MSGSIEPRAEGAGTVEPRLVVKGLTAGYRPDVPIIRNIDLIVHAAEMVCIIGPNGAGKSTLLKAVCGLLPVSAGSITLDQRNLLGVRPDRLARTGLSMVPQLDNIFRRLSVAQNLALAARRCPGGRVARRAAVERCLDIFPLLREKYNAQAGSLSGGQRQFLALAMALVSEPSVLLLDEPSAGLSPIAIADILGRLQRIAASGVAILMVEQNAKAALRCADRAYILASTIRFSASSISASRNDATMLQSLFDGLLVGSILALGAIGLTLVMHILRFANFSHAELISLGAYATLTFDRVFGSIAGVLQAAFPPLSVTLSLILAMLLAMLATGISATLIDRFVFRRLRERAGPLTMVFASFGVGLIVRNLLGLIYGLRATHYSNDIAFATMLSADPLLLVKADEGHLHEANPR